MNIKFLAVVVVVLTVFCVTLASSSVTTFKTGPFNVSVDLGISCNDINILKPEKSEMPGGISNTNYQVNMFGNSVSIILTRSDKNAYDITKAGTSAMTSAITSAFLKGGADKDTLHVTDREIDSKPGIVGSGYLPQFGSTMYTGVFFTSPKSKCTIGVMGNQTMMASALKTIHVTEAA
jgi:hypothetical protein